MKPAMGISGIKETRELARGLLNNGAAAAGPNEVEMGEVPWDQGGNELILWPGERQLTSGLAKKHQAQGRVRAIPSSEAARCTH